MTAQTDFDASFCPTPEQVEYAAKYASDFKLDSVFVPVNFPGKQRGVWTEGQPREVVMEGNYFALWVDRNNALDAFDLGRYGNALFRVYANGHVHLVDEA